MSFIASYETLLPYAIAADVKILRAAASRLRKPKASEHQVQKTILLVRTHAEPCRKLERLFCSACATVIQGLPKEPRR